MQGNSFEVSREAGAYICLTAPQQHVLKRGLHIGLPLEEGNECWVVVFHCWGWQRCSRFHTIIYIPRGGGRKEEWYIFFFDSDISLRLQMSLSFSNFCLMWCVWGRKGILVWALASTKTDLLVWTVLLHNTSIWMQMSGTLSSSMKRKIECSNHFS